MIRIKRAWYLQIVRKMRKMFNKRWSILWIKHFLSEFKLFFKEKLYNWKLQRIKLCEKTIAKTQLSSWTKHLCHFFLVEVCSALSPLFKRFCHVLIKVQVHQLINTGTSARNFNLWPRKHICSGRPILFASPLFHLLGTSRSPNADEWAPVYTDRPGKLIFYLPFALPLETPHQHHSFFPQSFCRSF